MITISVVVCTYNREDLLPGALTSLCEQTLASSEYEILVVDNASTDDTKSIVQSFIAKFPEHSIRYIYEGRAGLAHARNIALDQAVGIYISYLDDDARAEPDWLKMTAEFIAGTQQSIHCLGGPILPFYTDIKPIWFRDDYETFSWGVEPRMLRMGESFYGSNMIWRKSMLQSLGGFDSQYGVKSELLSVGEEVASFRKLWQTEEQPWLLYLPFLMVRHWVPAYKMSVRYRLKRSFVLGQSYVQLGRHREVNRIHHLVRTGGSVIGKTIGALFCHRDYPNSETWLVEEGQQIAHRCGILLGLLGIFPGIRQRPA